MNKAYILLGSNLGDPVALLRTARKKIEEKAGKILRESSLYTSKPWGFEADSDFLNQVVELQTNLDAVSLLDILLSIENEMGRIRSKKKGYESRLIDLDILLFNHDIIETQKLKVPHPLLPQRKFALYPLCEIAPLYQHPILKKSISELCHF